MPSHSLHLVAAALLASACDSAPPGNAPAHEVQDSAGVMIVENHTPAWSAERRWSVAGQPDLVLGADDTGSPFQFDRIRGVVRLSDGTVVVADGRTNEIRWFDNGGTFLGRVGGSGGGPGEFRYLSSIARLEGDSVLALDSALWRLSIFAPDRTLVRDVALTPVAANVEYVTALPGGRHLLATLPSLIPAARPPGVYRYPRVYFRYSADGSSVDTIASLPGYEFEIRLSEQSGSWIAGAIPFARAGVSAAGAGRWYTGDNAGFQFEERGMDGHVTRIVRYRAARRALTDGTVRSLEAQSVADLARPTDRRVRAVQRLFREVPRPDREPAFQSLHVGPGGHVFVPAWTGELAPPHVAPDRWWVFNPQGALLGDIAAPEGFRLHVVGVDEVTGVLTDELGVQRVAVFPLVRR